MRTLLALALAAFVAYCFARAPGAAAPRRRPARIPASPGRHVHAGDPTVRH